MLARREMAKSASSAVGDERALWRGRKQIRRACHFHGGAKSGNAKAIIGGNGAVKGSCIKYMAEMKRLHGRHGFNISVAWRPSSIIISATARVISAWRMRQSMPLSRRHAEKLFLHHVMSAHGESLSLFCGGASAARLLNARRVLLSARRLSSSFGGFGAREKSAAK